MLRGFLFSLKLNCLAFSARDFGIESTPIKLPADFYHFLYEVGSGPLLFKQRFMWLSHY